MGVIQYIDGNLAVSTKSEYNCKKFQSLSEYDWTKEIQRLGRRGGIIRETKGMVKEGKKTKLMKMFQQDENDQLC